MPFSVLMVIALLSLTVIVPDEVAAAKVLKALPVELRLIVPPALTDRLFDAMPAVSVTAPPATSDTGAEVALIAPVRVRAPPALKDISPELVSVIGVLIVVAPVSWAEPNAIVADAGIALNVGAPVILKPAV